VENAFSWGRGELIDHQGPGGWQAEILRQLEEEKMTLGAALQIALRAASSIKCDIADASCMVAWLILWHVYTCPGSNIVVESTGGRCANVWSLVSMWEWLCLDSNKFVMTARFVGPFRGTCMAIFKANRIGAEGWL
jgi:hypothetical protein